MNKIKDILKYLLIIPVLVASCQEERVIPPGPPVGDEVEIVFSIATGAGTRALTTPNEQTIDTVDVLVFKQGYFVERATADVVNGNNESKVFKVKLTKNTAGNNYLVVLANARQEVNRASLRGTKEEVLSTILFENNETDGRWPAKLAPSTKFRQIPMFGEYGPLPIDDELEKNLKDNPIPMYRSLARVDISSSASNFKLTSVHFYKYNTKGCVAPGPNAAWDKYPYSSDERRVTNVTVPSGTTAVEDFLEYNVDNNSLTSSIYVMEIDRAERNDYENASCLVVGGEYNNSGITTYYRIDFEIVWKIKHDENDYELIVEAGVENEMWGRTFARILRNHWYEIEITSVGGPGAPDRDKALHRTKNEMVVRATTWNSHDLEIEVYPNPPEPH